MEVEEKTFRPGIFVMMKYPDVGKVKARLAESIGEEAATGLYRAFIHDTLTSVLALAIPIQIAVHPAESKERFAQWLGPSYPFFSQQGADLGERLQNGFSVMFEQYHQVIALASDSPDLPFEILQRAVSSLRTHEVVIGPASDGGYYLIGFSRGSYSPYVFEQIAWSTERVLGETLSRVQSLTRSVCVLSEWDDIDTKSDLRQFYEKYKKDSSRDFHVMRYLRSHSELLESILSE